jgi:hypothetical protein
MRYLSVPTYQFTDTTGRTLTVREMREYPPLPIAFTMNHSSDEDFDEIASRPFVYGDGGEREAYKLHEANMVPIMDAGFDYSKLPIIKVPS